jgi:uncharacterized membrane protein YkvA (DUF1232 family)
MVFTTTRPEDAGNDTQANEAHVRAGFWPKLRATAGSIPFAEDVLAAYYCALDRNTPLAARATLWGALAYFVLPFDLAPDYLPIIGFADDAAALTAAMRMIASHMKPEHRQAAKRKLDKMAGTADVQP